MWLRFVNNFENFFISSKFPSKLILMFDIEFNYNYNIKLIGSFQPSNQNWYTLELARKRN